MVGGGHSHFHVQPTCSVEVVLCCVVDGVVTKMTSLNAYMTPILSGIMDEENNRVDKKISFTIFVKGVHYVLWEGFSLAYELILLSSLCYFQPLTPVLSSQ